MLLYNNTVLDISLKIQLKINHKKFTQQKITQENNKMNPKNTIKEKNKKPSCDKCEKAFEDGGFHLIRCKLCCFFRRRKTGENYGKLQLFSLDIQNPPVIPGEDRCERNPQEPNLRRCDWGFIHTSSPGMTGCLGEIYTQKKRTKESSGGESNLE